MSGTTSTVATLTATLSVFPVPGSLPGSVTYAFVASPDEGVAPILSGGQSGGAPLVIATPDAAHAVPGTDTGTLTAIQGLGGGTTFDVTVQGTLVAVVNVNVGVVTENGTFSLGTVSPPSLPPDAPAPAPAA